MRWSLMYGGSPGPTLSSFFVGSPCSFGDFDDDQQPGGGTVEAGRKNWLTFQALMARLVCSGMGNHAFMAIEPFKNILGTAGYESDPVKLLLFLRGINVWPDSAGPALMVSQAADYDSPGPR